MLKPGSFNHWLQKNWDEKWLIFKGRMDVNAELQRNYHYCLHLCLFTLDESTIKALLLKPLIITSSEHKAILPASSVSFSL